MNRKNVTVMLVVMACVFAVTMAAGTASAATGWFELNVIQVGPGGAAPNSYFLLEGAALPEDAWGRRQMWFMAMTAREKEQLATCLTALSAGLKVRVEVDQPFVAYSRTKNLYLTNLPQD